ncbi:MAG: MBL fold metallo-hydrolase [Pseudomonadota bacterium]
MTDPFERDTSVTYGVAEEIAVPGVAVRRITCRNPSPMTFTGTQTYLVGQGDDLTVIDPGPEDPAHRDAILRAAGGRIARILVTHTHVDHSAGAPGLAEASGAETHAFGPHGSGMTEVMRDLAGASDLGGGEGGDRGFRPHHGLADGDTVVGAGWTLRALHTPGHLSNHLSFALEGTGVVFTGDTVMGWATTLVSPPEGDMAAFMASLERLAARADTLYLPGHGAPVRDPAAMLSHQLAHRRQRAQQILTALSDGPAEPEALTRRIYVDLAPELLPAASRNVLATLIWQVADGAVRVEGRIGPRARYRLA